jgi:D-arabinose 1-dehydrogenase-like Zn-dependent alcohol dehydrogenase
MGARGRFVNIGNSSGQPMRVESPLLRSRELRIMGYTNNGTNAAEKAAALREVLALAAVGGVRIDHEVVPADQIASAWRSVADGSAPHRVILDLS